MFLVVRGNAVASHHDLIVSLISINNRRPDARMSIDAGHHQRQRSKPYENVVEIRAEESAITLLDDDGLVGMSLKICKDLATIRPLDSTLVPCRRISRKPSLRSAANSPLIQITGCGVGCNTC
jgi:hypothetical protein